MNKNTEDKGNLSLLSDFIDEKVKNDSRDGADWGIVNAKLYNQIKNKESLKRSLVISVEINKCKFIDCAMSASNFEKVIFTDTEFDGNNLMFCKFADCIFGSTEGDLFYQNNEFSQSEFINCSFSNIRFRSSTISSANFINCTFNSCIFDAVTLENTVFEYCEFHTVDMQCLNIEFTVFKKCNLDNVIFPFYQFPYILGAYDIFIDETANITLSANGQIAEKDKYSELLKDILTYFKNKNCYFPAVSLNLMLENKSAALECLKLGLDIEITDKNYRMIKHYCKLGRMYSLIDAHFATGIIAELDSSIINFKNQSDKGDNYYKTLNRMIIGIGEIRQLLMYDISEKYALQFEIATSIPSNKKRKISRLQSKLQKILDKYGQDAETKFIEIRHDSPWDLFVQIIAENPVVILDLSFMLISGVRYYGNRFIEWLKRRKDKNFYLKDMKKRYGDKVEIKDNEMIETIKTKIMYEMEKLSNTLQRKGNGDVSRDIKKCSQRIMGFIDGKFQDDTFLIFTTKNEERQNNLKASSKR